MPHNLVRYQDSGEFHFITFSCYHRQPFLANAHACNVFEQQLEWVRQRSKFVIAGYVVMPEHVHLLVGEPQTSPLAITLQVLKQKTSHLLKRAKDDVFWQRRYYDFNVWSQEKTTEKLRYMHRNPVVRGLVSRPEDWPWSSFRHYASGWKGTVEIESVWTAEQRGNQLPEWFASRHSHLDLDPICGVSLPTLAATARQGWGTQFRGDHSAFAVTSACSSLKGNGTSIVPMRSYKGSRTTMRR